MVIFFTVVFPLNAPFAIEVTLNVVSSTLTVFGIAIVVALLLDATYSTVFVESESLVIL